MSERPGQSQALEGRYAVTSFDETRFRTPLYTVAEAARIVNVPVSTLATWTRGYVRRFPDRPAVSGDAVVTHVSTVGPRQPSIPFVGLAEALVLAAVRRSGVSMHCVCPALRQLQEGLGVAHALAPQRLYTDGAELLFEYSDQHAADEDVRLARNLVVARNGQRVFVVVIEAYLRRIEHGVDGFGADPRAGL